MRTFGDRPKSRYSVDVTCQAKPVAGVIAFRGGVVATRAYAATSLGSKAQTPLARTHSTTDTEEEQEDYKL